jgi:hypothetical protein
MEIKAQFWIENWGERMLSGKIFKGIQRKGLKIDFQAL